MIHARNWVLALALSVLAAGTINSIALGGEARQSKLASASTLLDMAMNRAAIDERALIVEYLVDHAPQF